MNTLHGGMSVKKITLQRLKENFNKNCSYRICVGNRVLTELENGEEKTVEIPTQYEKEPLKAKMRWCGSNTLALKNLSQNERITVSGNKFLNRNMSLFEVMFSLTGMMVFRMNMLSRASAIGIFVLLLIGIIATLTVWKNRWLELKRE